MRFAARLFFVVFFLATLLFSVCAPSFAQSPTLMSQDTNTDVPQNLHTYTQTVMLETLSSVFCLLAGHDFANPQQQCLGFDSATRKIGYVPNTNGLIGTVSSGIIALYTPPISTGQYIQYLSDNFGLVKKTYAATNPCTNGVGFCGISPLIGIWTTFRNIVYLLFVVIFILVGVGIMLRQKIDPRTVMSIENQVPKLVIALVLVTFSFAIAGIMIDAMWLGSFVVVDVLTAADTQNPITPQTVNNNFFQNPLGFANNVLPGGILGSSFGAGGSLMDVSKGLLTGENSDKLGLSSNNITAVFTGGLTELIGAVFGNIIAIVLGLLGSIVVLIAILYSMIRVWFSLLLSYVYILLDILLGPFMIVFGIFPGSKIGFSAWARDILANLMAFPTVIAMFLLGRLLMDAFTTGTGGASIFVAPLIGNPNGVIGTTSPLGFLIGLAIILMTPQAVNMMKALFKAPDNKFAQQVFQSVGAGTGLGAIGKAGSIGYTISGLRGLPIIGRAFGKILPGGGITGHPPAGGHGA